MGQDISVRIYFADNKAQAFSEISIKRTANQLCRAGIETMGVLSDIPVDELKKLRNIGKNSLEIILFFREKYAAESANS
ncbi:MAG: hypothetical protein LBD23_09710 [Oscillospiraceae bacterium]|nr:hypothetical protein [Oscillospiraceae bacterium]